MKTLSTPLKNQSGQGVIEYILVLVVTVGIILGVIYQINDAFRVWASNYFGEYLTCLLETGELPSLSSGEEGICNQQFAEFSISNGRPLIGGGVDSGNNGDGSRPSSPGSSSSSSSSGESSGGAARPGMSNTSTIGGSNRFRASRSSSGGGTSSSSGAGSKESYTGSTDGIAVSQILQRNGKASYVAIQRIGGRGLDGTRARDDNEKSKVKIKGSISTNSKPNRRALMKVQPPEKKFTEVREIDDFTIGSFFRYLIIAAIIIILILLIVLQGGEIRKSMNAE